MKDKETGGDCHRFLLLSVVPLTRQMALIETMGYLRGDAVGKQPQRRCKHEP